MWSYFRKSVSQVGPILRHAVLVSRQGTLVPCLRYAGTYRHARLHGSKLCLVQRDAARLFFVPHA